MLQWSLEVLHLTREDACWNTALATILRMQIAKMERDGAHINWDLAELRAQKIMKEKLDAVRKKRMEQAEKDNANAPKVIPEIKEERMTEEQLISTYLKPEPLPKQPFHGR